MITNIKLDDLLFSGTAQMDVEAYRLPHAHTSFSSVVDVIYMYIF